MNRFLASSLILLIGPAIMSSCGKEEVQAAKAELREGWDELKEFTVDRREVVQVRLEEAMDDLGRQVDQIDDRLEEGGEAAKEQYEDLVADLRQQRAALGGRIEELREAGEDVWVRTRVEVVDAVKAFERSVEDAWTRLRS